MLFSLIIIIIYCRKKCTRQSLKVLWVVLSALFFKEIWKNGTEGHGHMFASAKGKKQQYVRQLQSSRTMYWSYPILSFGIDVCTFLPTTFLEIAVWFKTPACRRQPAGFFQPWPRSWTRDCRETFPVSGQSSIQTQEIRITRLTRRLLGHAAPKAKSRGALGHAAPSLQKRSTSSCKHKKQIFLRKSVRRQTYFHHPISRLHNP